MKQELDRLSLKYLRASSRWQKLVNSGHLVPTTNADGTANYLNKVIKRMSPEEVLSSLKSLEEAEAARAAQKLKDDVITSVAQKASGVLNVKELSESLV